MWWVDVSISISIQDNVIIPNSHIKVSGITLGDSLKFDLHISDMWNKASRQVNVLKRMSFLIQDSRKLIYRSFIAANFNYRPIYWIFCGKKNTSKLENYTLNVIFYDQTATYIFKMENFLSLKAYRIRSLVVIIFPEEYNMIHSTRTTFQQFHKCIPLSVAREAQWLTELTTAILTMIQL